MKDGLVRMAEVSQIIALPLHRSIGLVALRVAVGKEPPGDCLGENSQIVKKRIESRAFPNVGTPNLTCRIG